MRLGYAHEAGHERASFVSSRGTGTGPCNEKSPAPRVRNRARGVRPERARHRKEVVEGEIMVRRLGAAARTVGFTSWLYPHGWPEFGTVKPSWQTLDAQMRTVIKQFTECLASPTRKPGLCVAIALSLSEEVLDRRCAESSAAARRGLLRTICFPHPEAVRMRPVLAAAKRRHALERRESPSLHLLRRSGNNLRR